MRTRLVRMFMLHCAVSHGALCFFGADSAGHLIVVVSAPPLY